ncbi:hypothetical protein [Metabacillus sp. B2-18]|uniref:hypothetical protein n=1 Tax=Metabacillus sp. B2-18 TaxID=2897333 RepID=UPI001E47FA02|nr:hypothetical protein [Metabacillus sp. B2-18]UGB28936.1 hypothetical protein LPC09_14305 [Metabacillus sp. B2-18]
MNQEKLLADELSKMIEEDQIPLSITEDIHEISGSLRSGNMSLNDLKGKDAFIEKAINEAKSRLHM